MKNLMYFKINNGPEMQFAEIEEGASFKFEITKFPTKEELEKIENYYHLVFTDKEGNNFKLYSKPE